MHNRIVDAVGSVLPIQQIMSIDEMTCRLIGHERNVAFAIDAANRIKAAIKSRAGDYLTCSIGIAPNTLLAKVAADMKKPDGLTVVADTDLPDALHGLKLNDFPGIGPRMTRRLNLFGVFAVSQLCSLSMKAMSEAWGVRFWAVAGTGCCAGTRWPIRERTGRR